MILVVEDDDTVRPLVQLFLEYAGFSVLVASDGDSGWDAFTENRAEVALLLTDIDMPRMNGLKLAEQVLSYDPGMSVLFMTGGTTAPNRGHGCFTSPFGEQMVARVRSALAAPNVPALENAQEA